MGAAFGKASQRDLMRLVSWWSQLGLGEEKVSVVENAASVKKWCIGRRRIPTFVSGKKIHYTAEIARWDLRWSTPSRSTKINSIKILCQESRFIRGDLALDYCTVPVLY